MRFGSLGTGAWLGVAKVFKAFRFKPQLYAQFTTVAKAGGFTVTEVLTRFMQDCVDADAVIFPEKHLVNFETEARVLVDWLSKGKRFYRDKGDVEINVQGRLFELLGKVQDTTLLSEMKEALQKSV